MAEKICKTKAIPLNWGKKILEELGYSEVVIFAVDENTGVQSVCTYGKSLENCKNAAENGNVIKKLLHWPDELCHAKPARQIKTEKK